MTILFLPTITIQTIFHQLSRQSSLMIRVFALTGTLLMTGCVTTGVDVDKLRNIEDIKLPTEWNHNFGTLSDTKTHLQTWWNQLDDAQLTALIERSSSNNLSVQIALKRIEQAQAQYQVSVAGNYPSANLSASVTRERSNSQLTGRPSITENYQRATGLISWEIDLFGRVRQLEESAFAAVDVSVENYRDTLVTLYAQIARTYVALRTLQKQLLIAEKNVANQVTTVELVRTRYEVQLASELDVNQAEQNLVGSQAAIPPIKTAITRTLNRLTTLVGERPGALNSMLVPNNVNIPVAPKEVVVSFPRELVRQRPDIRRAEKQLMVQTALVGVAETARYPRLSLDGTFGLAAFSGELFSKGSDFWRFGPNLTWNIFDAGRTESQVKAQYSVAEQARIGYEQTVLSAFEQVENGLTNYSGELKRLHLLRKSVALANKTARFAKAQYRNGLTNFQTVLDSERVLFAQENQMVASEGALTGYFIDIYRAMGGGLSQ